MTVAKPSAQGGCWSRARRAAVRLAIAGGLLLGSWLAGASAAFAADELDDIALVPELVAAVERTELVPELVGLLEPEEPLLEPTGLLPAEPSLPDIAAVALLNAPDPGRTGAGGARPEGASADTAPPPAPPSAPPVVDPQQHVPAPEPETARTDAAPAEPVDISAPEPAIPTPEHRGDDLPPLPEPPSPLTALTATSGQGCAAFRAAPAVLPSGPAAPHLPRALMRTSEPRVALPEASYDQPDFPD